MSDVKFTLKGKKDLEKLPKEIQLRIIRKIKFFASQNDPLIFSQPLTNLPPTTHRFRVGPIRVAFYISKDTIYIDRIRHRKEVYLF